MIAPLRRLTDDELRVHASQLFDLAFGGLGDVHVLASVERSAVLRSSARDASTLLSFALGNCGPEVVNQGARACAGLALAAGRRDAARALLALGRRARLAGAAGQRFPRANIDVCSGPPQALDN